MKRSRLILSSLSIVLLPLVYLNVYGKRPDNPKPADYKHPAKAEVGNRVGKPKSTALKIDARSVLAIDNDQDIWLYAKEPRQIQPIASLTKLLTAMVYLDFHPRLDTTIYINSRHCFQSASSRLRQGELYKAIDLLYAALVSSDNRAARALINAAGCTEDYFVAEMNAKARDLGMMNTQVFEVTGLDERNVSTSADIAILMRESMKYPLIQTVTSTYTYRCKPLNRKRFKNFTNTNRLLKSEYKVIGGKTGYILESKYCLATILRDKKGKELTLVVLGAPTNSRRFSVARKLAQYAFQLTGRKDYGAR